MGAYRHLLIDDQGQAWPPGSMQLRAVNFAADADFDFVDYALRNLGFVEITQTADRTRLRLRPRVVAEAALAAVMHLLADNQPSRTALSWLANSWTDEIFGDWKRLGRRIIDLVTGARVEASNKFLIRPRDTDELAANDPLRDLADWWKSTSGTIDQSRLEDAMQDRLTSRYMVADARSDGALLVLALGNGFVIHNELHRKAVIGQRFEDQFDYDYAKWVGKFYREALTRREPRVDDIDVMVRRHDGRCRVRYRRIILPFRLDNSATRLISVSTIDPTIDLRVEV